MAVEITTESFDPYVRLRDFQQQRLNSAQYGAEAVFVGYMRDQNDGVPVAAMTLEHYPGMTEQHLEAISASAATQWPLQKSLIVHRVGNIQPGEAIVLVAVWSAHRAAAFDACRYIMEDLKAKAPFWKKEQRADGERWVEQNTPGYTNKKQD